jgi:hypothetical protein
LDAEVGRSLEREVGRKGEKQRGSSCGFKGEVEKGSVGGEEGGTRGLRRGEGERRIEEEEEEGG